MVVPSTRKVAYRLVLKPYSNEEAFIKILKSVNLSLYNFFTRSHAALVKSIILQAVEKLSFDLLEYESILHSSCDPRDNFLQFSQLVQSRQNAEQLKSFLEILVNLETLDNTSESIKSLIIRKFDNLVEIKEERLLAGDKKPLIEHQEPIVSKKRSKLTRISKTVKKYPTLTGFIVTSVLLLLGISMFWKELLTLLHAWLVISSSGEAVSSKSPASLPSANITQFTETTLTAKTNLYATNDVLLNTIAITQSPPTLIGRSIQSNPLPKYRVKATSYDHYVRGMTNLPLSHEVVVSIVLRNPLDWPAERNVILPNSSEITKLLIDGPIAVDNLIDILSQTVNIKLLQIRNTGDKLCQRNQGQLNLVKGINNKAYLPLLKSLVIQYFTSCTEVYETLATYLEPSRELKSIVFHRSLINDQNHVFLRKLLQNNAESLKELKLAHTRISVSNPFLEVGGSLIFSKVETIRLDSVLSDGGDDEIPVGKSLSKMFPNLRALYSNHGYVQWSEFPNILQCKNLTKLQIGINVPVGRTFFDVSFFKKYLPNVTNAHIALNFLTCKTPVNGVIRKNEIIGWENVRYPLGEIVVRSNCKIHAIMSNATINLQNYRIQVYKSDNGKYIFTYKNKE